MNSQIRVYTLYISGQLNSENDGQMRAYHFKNLWRKNLKCADRRRRQSDNRQQQLSVFSNRRAKIEVSNDDIESIFFLIFVQIRSKIYYYRA